MTGLTDPIEGILDLVQDALLAADYTRLGALATEIEVEMDRVAALRDVAVLKRVQAKALRNEACLLAAQRGFRAARRRVAEIRAARAGLVTYDTKGRRAAPPTAGELTKRF